MRCPICNAPLIHEGKVFVCKNRHSFDQARQGYVNLSRKQKPGGDNALMSAARSAFLETGAYDFLRDTVTDLIKEKSPDQLVDLGCGEGYYTRAMAQFCHRCYGVDLSISSLRKAAGCDKLTQYVAASIFNLPFEDCSVDYLVSIFTPIPADEAYRILRPGKWFLIAGPGIDHHRELKEVLYPQVRLNDPVPDLDPDRFTLEQSVHLKRKVHVRDVWTLLEMTPYRYKCPKEGLERVRNLEDGLDVTFEFEVRVWRKNES